MAMRINKLYHDEEGADIAEYGLIIGLLAAVAAGILLVFGKQIKGAFEYLQEKMKGGAGAAKTSKTTQTY